MNRISKTCLVIGLALSLSACTENTTVDDLPVVAGNGLPFASISTAVEDATDQEVKVQLLRYLTDLDTDVTTLDSGEETVTMSNMSLTSGGVSGTMTYRGETLTFVDSESTLASGAGIYLYSNTEGVYSLTFDIFSLTDNSGDETFNTEGNFALGFETDPNVLVDTLHAGGAAVYDGDIDGYGTSYDSLGDVLEFDAEISGNITLSVSFVDNTVDGDIYVEFFGTTDIVTDTLHFTEADLVGNGFAANGITETTCNVGVCASNSQIIGTIYGPNADEISGVIGIDYSQFDGTDGGHFIGSAGYTAPLD